MEEQKRYPSSDKESGLGKDKLDDHSGTLKDSNPAWTKLKAMGIAPERPEVPSVEPEKVEESKDTSEVEEVVEQTLSAFGQWLGSLKRPSLAGLSHTAPVEPAEATQIEQPESSTTGLKSDDPTVANATEKEAKTKAVKAKKDKAKKKKKKGGKKKKKAVEANRQVTLSEGVYSETLAELMVSQGHIDEAIEMYDKMRLIYPEKSRLFAAKIAELNKKA